MKITLPNNGWTPRPYQQEAYRYLQNIDGKDDRILYLIAHRRWGKDDLALHSTAVKMMTRVGTYWHCLPLQTQARRAIWEAVNPHTGMRRIDEAFPKALREVTREQEMFIRFINGSTWTLTASDSYDSLVGSPPVGIVFSEWALAKPQVWAYIRPILRENNGWAAFITTPRGNNHAAKMYYSFQEDKTALVLKQTAEDTSVFTEEDLKAEHKAYIAEYGTSIGEALYEQEYLCSFDASIVGSIFGKDVKIAEEQDRITDVPYDPTQLVYTSWDLGEGDATSCWFFQFDGIKVNYIDYYEANREKTSHYLAMLQGRGYDYDTCLLPHDSEHKRMNADQTIAGQFRSNGFRVDVVPQTPKKLQIAAGSNRSAVAHFDKEKCGAGLEGLKNYRWNYNKRIDETTSTPVHDWASHPSDAFMYGCLSKGRNMAPLEPLKYPELGIV